MTAPCGTPMSVLNHSPLEGGAASQSLTCKHSQLVSWFNNNNNNMSFEDGLGGQA